jgi:hypothetical protein
MKVKDLMEQLSKMNPEYEVYLSIYHPDDSGDQDHYDSLCAVEYDGKDGHVQIKGQ